MSKRLLIPIALAGALAAGSLAVAAGQKSGAAKEAGAKAAPAKGSSAKGGGMPSQQEQMEAWMKMAQPGEHHAVFKALAGSWKTIVKSWEGEPEPKVSGGSCESSVIMDGRYLKEECAGDFGGMPFQGMGLTGYDNMKKKYVGSWIDNFGTGILDSEGTIDAAMKTITYHAMMPDMANPMSPKMVNARMTTTIVDDNTHVLTMYGNMAGKEVKRMEITYTRQ